MTQKFFSEKMKLADIIGTNYYLILLLPRLGIPLGFGDKTVEQVCKEHQVSVDFVVLICNVYTYSDYLPTHPHFEEMDMSPLIPYLQASHNYYLNERLPHIERHLDGMVAHIDARYAEVLRRFLVDYKQEVTNHFTKEEQKVFTSLKHLEEGQAVKGGFTKLFVKDHASLVDKLSDLTQIIYKYLPSEAVGDICIELVFDIMQLSADLEKHTIVEENILLPYAEYLERRLSE